VAARGQLKLADPGGGGAAQLCQQLRGLLAPGVVLPDQEPVQARLAQAARVRGAGVALKERERDPAVQVREQPSGPGQNRASSARSWLLNAVRVPTRSSLARVSALSALVWSLSGSKTRKRW